VSSTLTYVYCLVRAARRPPLRTVPRGMPGGTGVRLLEVPLSAASQRRAAVRHWLVVSTVPVTMYGENALQEGIQQLEWVGPRALAHEGVIEHFLKSDAVLPMQLFALFKSDDRAIEHVLRNRRRIARILLRIERQVEWGLRLMWDPNTHEADVPPGVLNKRVPERRAMSGAEYLTRKRTMRNRSRVQMRRARADAVRMYRAIAGEASEARRRFDVERAAPGSRLLLEAAFLVPARRARAFRAAVSRHTGALEQSGIAVSLTGPWPPYNFI
jgi:Gas vesicle synthesis protein GvpL/GvpF